MNLSAPFIRRPVMTTLVMASFAGFGLLAYAKLPVSDLPNVDYPTISVSASFPGASPETMAASVATPLERQFSTIAGLTAMNSSSGLGLTQITLEFALERNIDAAAQDVQSMIAAAGGQLPPDMPTPPTFRKVNPADAPILFLALTSPALPMSTLNRLANDVIAQRVSTIPGVAQVMVYGAQKYAARIELDPKALAARGIGLDEAAAAIRSANPNLPTGVVQGAARAYTVDATGGLRRAKDFARIPIAFRNGAPVRVEDVGRARDGVENEYAAAWYNEGGVSQRAIVLAVQRQPGTNTVEVATTVRDLLPAVSQQLPAAAELNVLYDRSESIQDSVHDVKSTLLLTLALVVLVIFLFLRNLPATIIPSLALPVSLIGTFALMQVLGYSLDNLSLMALTLAVGFVVDDAIVMLENVVRHMEMGKRPLQAAFDGSREVAFTIVSMTISLAAVFLPVLFMGGIVGRLFHEFAVTIGAAILVSGLVSLTLTPMLCSRFLRHEGKAAHGRAYQAIETGFDAVLRWYGRGLDWSLAHRRTVLAISTIVFLAMIPLFMAAPKGFLPSEDTGRLQGRVEAPEGISWEAMKASQQEAAAIIARNPGVEQFMSSAGAGRSTTGVGFGTFFMKLVDRHERPGVETVLAQLRDAVSGFPGLRVSIQNPPSIPIGGMSSFAQYQFTLSDADMSSLFGSAKQLEARMRDLPGLLDVTSDLRLSSPRATVQIDRDRAAALGVSPLAIEDALYTAYGDRQISTIYAPEDQYQVILSLTPGFRLEPESLSSLYVRGAAGTPVPLGTLALVGRSVGPLTVNHTGQLPSVTISFNLRPGTSLGEAVASVQKTAADVLPPTVSTKFQGTAQAFQNSLKGLGVLLVMAILVIYVVLGILYESFIHPITILTALPFAGFGALVTLGAFRIELTIYAFVGIIMLVGLVKKNGIMMVDFAIEAQKAGKSARDAIHEACMVRFRPIMMTTMAALMGTLPIALGFGAGAEARRPLGLAVVGGLVFSQVLTLFVTPVFYVVAERLRHRRVAPAGGAGSTGASGRSAAAPEG